MNWSRVKTILIILFLFTDILLGAGVISSTRKANTVEPEIISSTVSLLGQHNITIAPEIIPTKTPDAEYIEAENTITDYGKFAEDIMREKPQKTDEFTYETDRSVLSFSGDCFSYKIKLAEKLFNDGSFDSDLENSAKVVAANFLSANGFDIKHADISTTKTDNGFDVTFIEKSGKMPVFSSNITVSVTGHNAAEGESNGIHEVSGSWFNITNQNGSAVELKSITGILIEFMSMYNGELPTAITALTLGYTVFEADTLHRTATLVPVWRITTDNGSEYFLDARTTD